MQKRLVAIVTGPDTYLDHLAPICYCLQMPLIVTEEKTYQSAKTFYPQIEVIYKELNELSLEYIAHNFDAIFESGKFFASELKPFLSLMYQKQVRFVFCPHGNSDKGHSMQTRNFQDISLVYGDHMLDLLKQTKAFIEGQEIVRTGNYRLPFYLKYKNFYNELASQILDPVLDSSKKTILYAPTWQDGENPSSFFSSTDILIEQLSKKYNLIIKLHPFLEQFHPAHTYYILAKYKEREGVFFLENFPCIYPLLDRVDLYIGDYSSIGYDFLFFDRPLYFLPGEKKSFSLLHECGMEISLKEDILSFIEKTGKENKEGKRLQRHKTYHYAFGEEKPFDTLRKELLQLFN